MGRLMTIFLLVASGVACDEAQRPGDAVVLKGTVGFGTLQSGTVAVYEYDKCSRGNQLAKGELKNSDGFELKVPAGSEPMPILVELSNFNYMEDWSDTVVSSADVKLYGASVIEPDEVQKNVVVSFWTHVAKAMADQECSIHAMQAVNSIDKANALFSSILTFDIHEDKPLRFRMLNAPAFTVRELARARYGVANAAISSYTLDIDADSLEFAEMAYNDVAFDGMLNGVSKDGPMVLGSASIDEETYRTDLAIHMDAIVLNLANLPADIDASVLGGIVDKFHESSGSDVFGFDKPMALADSVPPPILIGKKVSECKIVIEGSCCGGLFHDSETIYGEYAKIEIEVYDPFSTYTLSLAPGSSATVTLADSVVPWRTGLKPVVYAEAHSMRAHVIPAFTLEFTNDYGKTLSVTTNVNTQFCTIN